MAKDHRDEAGQLLIPYRGWRNWIKQFGFSDQAARNYMRIAQWATDRGKIKSLLKIGLEKTLSEHITKHQNKDDGPQEEGDAEYAADDEDRADTFELVTQLRDRLPAKIYQQIVDHAQMDRWKFFGQAVWDRGTRPVILLPERQRGRGLIKTCVDSGAYSAWKAGEEIDPKAYCQFLLDNQEWIDLAISLDVIDPSEPNEAAKESWDNFEFLSSELKGIGLDPVPIYHIGEDLSWLQKMIDRGCPYIGLSATSIGTDLPKRISEKQFYQEAWALLVDSSGNPRVKVHAFGDTQRAALLAYPWQSADSSSWANGLRHGTINYTMLPRELLKKKGDEGDAARTFAAATYYERIEREINRKNRGLHHTEFVEAQRAGEGTRLFELFFAISNVWSLPTLRAVHHRKALVSYWYLRSGKKLLNDVKQYIHDPDRVLADDKKYDSMMKIKKLSEDAVGRQLELSNATTPDADLKGS